VTATPSRENWRKEGWRASSVRWLKFNAVGGIGIAVQVGGACRAEGGVSFRLPVGDGAGSGNRRHTQFFVAPALHLVRQDIAGPGKDRRCSRASPEVQSEHGSIFDHRQSEFDGVVGGCGAPPLSGGEYDHD